MIEICDVCKKYGDKVIFDHFNLQIKQPSFVVITGESGCGKTTLLNMLGFLEKPDSGKIMIDGRLLKEIGQTTYFQNEVGFLFQNYALMEDKTVRQNLEIVGKKNRTGISFDEALGQVGMQSQLQEKVYKLSGGEQQRVALARLMIKKCNIVLADEPTGSLDERNGRIVMDCLHRMREDGRTIVMVTHNRAFLPEAEQVVEL